MAGHPSGFSQALGTVIVSAALLVLGRTANTAGLPAFYYIAWGIVGLTLVVTGFDIMRQWRRTRDIDALLEPTGTYGVANLADADEVKSFRLGEPIDGSGNFLGAIGETPLSYRGNSHLLTVAPNAGGKTESVVIPNALSIKRNAVITDKGGEVAARTFKVRRDILRQYVYVINPWELLSDEGLPNHYFNPIGDLPELANANPTELVDRARAVALILKPDPENKGENQFFRDASRNLKTWLIIYLAYREADTGELCCNLPHIQSLVSGSKEDFETLLSEMIRAKEYGNGTVAKEAAAIRARAERNPKTFEAILTEVQNALALFTPLGPLGKATTYSDFDPRDLKKKPMTVYVAAPPEKLNGPYGPWAGLVVDSLIQSTLAARSLHPRVTFLLDEFANLSSGPLPSIIPALYVGRSYGCQIWPFIQDRKSLKRYGDEASAFETQAEIVQIWGIRDLDDAKWIEERAGTVSVMTETGNLPIADGAAIADGNHSMSLSEKGVPVVSKGDALQLPDFKQLILFKNKPVILADLISYRMVRPWVAQASILRGDEGEPDLPIRFTFN